MFLQRARFDPAILGRVHLKQEGNSVIFVGFNHVFSDDFPWLDLGSIFGIEAPPMGSDATSFGKPRVDDFELQMPGSCPKNFVAETDRSC